MSKPQAEANKKQFYKMLADEYDSLSNGDKASIRKTVEPDDLQINPVFYRLIQSVLMDIKEKEQKNNAKDFFQDLAKISRLVYFLPFVQHPNEGKTLGALFKNKEISERRLFLVMRSEYPQDLVQLRRLCQQAKPNVQLDWLRLADLLAWWGKDKNRSEYSKRQLMQDFYLSKDDKEQAEVESTP